MSSRHKVFNELFQFLAQIDGHSSAKQEDLANAVRRGFCNIDECIFTAKKKAAESIRQLVIMCRTLIWSLTNEVNLLENVLVVLKRIWALVMFHKGVTVANIDKYANEAIRILGKILDFKRTLQAVGLVATQEQSKWIANMIGACLLYEEMLRRDLGIEIIQDRIPLNESSLFVWFAEELAERLLLISCRLDLRDRMRRRHSRKKPEYRVYNLVLALSDHFHARRCWYRLPAV